MALIGTPPSPCSSQPKSILCVSQCVSLHMHYPQLSSTIEVYFLLLSSSSSILPLKLVLPHFSSFALIISPCPYTREIFTNTGKAVTFVVSHLLHTSIRPILLLVLVRPRIHKSLPTDWVTCVPSLCSSCLARLCHRYNMCFHLAFVLVASLKFKKNAPIPILQGSLPLVLLVNYKWFSAEWLSNIMSKELSLHSL